MAEQPQARLLGVLHAAGALETEVESRLSAIGLSMAKLAALYQLVLAGDSLPLGQLAERLSCVKSNVTQLVDRLESDGLVSREGDPSDRRSRLAVLTPEGKRSFQRGMEIHEQAERDLFGALTKSESEELAKLLTKLEQRHA